MVVCQQQSVLKKGSTLIPPGSINQWHLPWPMSLPAAARAPVLASGLRQSSRVVVGSDGRPRLANSRDMPSTMTGPTKNIQRIISLTVQMFT